MKGFEKQVEALKCLIASAHEIWDAQTHDAQVRGSKMLLIQYDIEYRGGHLFEPNGLRLSFTYTPGGVLEFTNPKEQKNG